MRQTNLPLRNLRGVLLILILSFHAFSAYIVSQPPAALPFDQPPYDWRAFPIIDSDRWIGFDLFCAFQFLYLMQLMFFLSGVFVWPSLQRRGWKPFLTHRLVRLGIPFFLGTYLLMPIAYFATYRVTASDPSWSAFLSHWTALPFTPTGPMWFLWFLVVLDVIAVALWTLLPHDSRLMAAFRKVANDPFRFLIFVICVTAAAYLPLSAFYSPWHWGGIGPFEVQTAFAPQYVIYFLLGLAAGAQGLDRGLLDAEGIMVQRWRSWVVASLLSFVLWVAPTALIMKVPGAPTALLHVLADLGLVTFAATACLSLLAIFLRYATARWPLIDSISDNAYGVYFFHYVFVLWLQYLLLRVAFPAIGKGVIVLALTVVFSLAASLLTNRLVAGARLLFEAGAGLLASHRAAKRLPLAQFLDSNKQVLDSRKLSG